MRKYPQYNDITCRRCIHIRLTVQRLLHIRLRHANVLCCKSQCLPTICNRLLSSPFVFPSTSSISSSAACSFIVTLTSEYKEKVQNECVEVIQTMLSVRNVVGVIILQILFVHCRISAVDSLRVTLLHF